MYLHPISATEIAKMPCRTVTAPEGHRYLVESLTKLVSRVENALALVEDGQISLGTEGTSRF